MFVSERWRHACSPAFYPLCLFRGVADGGACGALLLAPLLFSLLPTRILVTGRMAGGYHTASPSALWHCYLPACHGKISPGSGVLAAERRAAVDFIWHLCLCYSCLSSLRILRWTSIPVNCRWFWDVK
jgi:hypothetical protein